MDSDDFPHVPWMRYWLPRGTEPQTDASGFLSEPDYKGEGMRHPVRIANSEARTYAELAATPCLVLLGEPGAGKSTELAHADESGAVRVDLGEVASEYGFIETLVRQPALAAWKANGKQLTLLVDAYDEALLRVESAAQLLLTAVTAGLPDDPDVRAARAATLRLRVASRGGVWPDSVTQAFRAFWGETGVGVYTLASLRREDAALAALTWGAPDGFLATVAEAEAGAWAALPLTLRWLVQIVKRDAALPATRRELFERGALLLCEEQNPNRRNADRFGMMTPRQRLALAGRLAALMRFGGRASLSLAPGDEHPEGSLAGADAEGTETSQAGDSFTVGPSALRDLARDTALFRTAGPDLFRWTQESTADFLAAWYLNYRGASAAQMLSLVTDPDDGHAVPQLIEVAAWAASFSTEVFDHLAGTDPNIAVGGDPQALPPDARRDGLDRYLEAVGDGRVRTLIDPVPWSTRSLSHPGLTDQLRGWILDQERPERGRAAAARAAADNRLAELAPDLGALARDSASPFSLRATAVYMLRLLGTPEDLVALRPLAVEPSPDASRLRAAVRNVLWPGMMSFSDLVASVALSPGDDESGHLFADPLPSGRTVSDDEVAEALGWIEDGHAHRAPPLAQGAVTAAARRAHVPEVGHRLGALLVGFAERQTSRDRPDRLRVQEPEVRRALAELGTPRPHFLESLVDALASAGERVSMYRLRDAFRPVRLEDVGPLADRLDLASDEPLRTACTEFMEDVLGPPFPVRDGDRDRAEEALAAVEARGVLSPAVHALVRSVRATWARQSTPPPEPEPFAPPVAARLDAVLSQPLTADTWHQVQHVLALRPSGQRTHLDHEVDPAELTGWDTLCEPYRAQVADAAQVYLEGTAPDASDWARSVRRTSDWSERVGDGVRALALLHCLGAPAADALWLAWAPALVLRAAGGLVAARQDGFNALLRHSRRVDPDAFRGLVARAYASLGDADALRRSVETLGDPELDAVLVRAIEAESVGVSSAHNALCGLLHRRVPGADAETARRSAGAETPEEQAMWAHLHFQYAPAGAWHAYAGGITSNKVDDVAFTRSLLQRIADRSGMPALSLDTPVPALIALERRLHALLDPALDPPVPRGVYSSSAADQIRDLRGGFAAALASQGTPEAVEAVRALADVLPEATAQYQLKRARTRRREVAHERVSPAILLALVARADARLVRSSQELFDVTVEALGGFEPWIRDGEAPRVFDLWNDVPRSDALYIAATLASAEASAQALALSIDAFRTSTAKNPSFSFPRDEGALADLALRFLRERLGPRGILVTREAEVKRGHATDLYVSAPVPGDAPAATVVIEVKGSWHPHVYSALQDQLVDGYLDGSTRRHGVYLVGWYGPDGWYRLAGDALHPKAEKARRGGRTAFEGKLATRVRLVDEPLKQVTVIVVDASLPPPRASA